MLFTEQIRPGSQLLCYCHCRRFDFASTLIKTREGRPIKVESNTDAPALGGANARACFSVFYV